jgi:plasmid stabilization system protein ParE
MRTYDVLFLQEALDDLEEIILYIAADSRTAALKMHDEIVAKADSLSAFPLRGRSVPDAKMQKSGFRMLLIKPYIVFYRVLQETVYIHRVIHGAANLPLLNAKLSDAAPQD